MGGCRKKSGRSCEAWCPANTYSQAHRCEKKHGLKLVRGKRLCPHHATMKSVKTVQERYEELV